MQETHRTVFVGVDIGKDRVSMTVLGRAGVVTLANAESQLLPWLRQLPAGSLIAMESTGRYHWTLCRLAHSLGHRVYVLNAKDVYFYAKAIGMRRKTDRTDAVVIAQYLAEHHQRLKAWTPPTDSNARLQELLHCRARVSAKLSSLRQLLRGVGGLAQASKVQQALHDLLAEIDQQISQLLASDEQLCRGSACLRTITGIGLQGSAMLAALFSRLPFGTGDSVVAYSGLDPRPHESGNSRGRRRLAKRGDPLLRRQMYLCAFAACHSKAFGPLYRSLKARGFKPTEAMVILARKLLRIAWAVWKTNQPFNPAMAPSPSACQTT